MPVPHVSRHSRTVRVLAAGATAALAVGGLAVAGAGSAGAATSTLVTVTKTSVHRLPALTANQVITLTGTGFDEDVISGVTINGCTTAPTYVVASPTSMLLKTAADCATTSTGVITITDTAGNTAVTNPAATGGAMALVFVAAPTIATASATVNPVVTENSQAVAFADQVTSAATKGGTVVRVKAGATPFVNTATYKLSASLGGTPMTNVTMPTGGAYFTGTLGARAAAAAPVLKITSNGVSKSFVYDAAVDGDGARVYTAGTHTFQYKGTGISVAPAFGSVAGGTVLTVTGSGFVAGAGATTVTVGGVSCPVVAGAGAITATAVKCTVPAAASAAAGPVTVKTTTGTVESVIGAGSTFTYLNQ